MKLQPSLSRRSLAAFISLIALVVTLSAASQPAQANRVLPPADRPADRTEIASLEPVEGLVQYQLYQDVEAEPTATLQWSTTNEVVLVSEGDRIRTDSGGYAYLTFFEGLETDIGPDSEVVVSTMDIPPAGENGNFDVTLDVLVGNTYSNVETVLDEQDRFEIHTPGATAVVRGTQWYTLVKPNGDTIFSALESTLFVFQHAGVGPDTPPPQLSDLIQLQPGFSLLVNSQGEAGEPYEGMDALLAFPQGGSLAPLTCGNGTCEANEEGTCAVDCLAPDALPQCGDGTCDAAGGEGLLTCGEDCGPFEGAQCGNGTCDADESGLSCPADCEPGDYFSPVSDAWCGNGICDISESALTCLDCAAPAEGPDLGLLCVLTAQGEPVRTGPDASFPAVFLLGAGQQLDATGVNQNGTWFAVEQDGQQLWVRAAGVTANGSCGGLPILTGPTPPQPTVAPPQPQPTLAPQPTFPPQPTATSAGPGRWLPCGSCTTCGYAAEECVTSPDGQCLWDPATCRVTPTPPPTTAPRQPYLTVPSGSYTCNIFDVFAVTVTYVQVDDATVDSYSASSSNPAAASISDYSGVSPTQFNVFVACNSDYTSPDAVISVSATDTAGRQVGTSFSVTVITPS